MPCKSQRRTGKTTLKIPKVSPQEQQCDEDKQEAIPCDDKFQKTVYGHNVEARESQRCRIQESGKNGHVDHVVDKGYNSTTHHNLVHKPIPIPQSMKIPEAEAGVDKEWGWREYRVKSKKEVVEHGQK